MLSSDEIRALNARFEMMSTAGILGWVWDQFGTRAAIGTSFQGAGLVMMHQAQVNGWPFPVFTLDTGLLFPETIELKRRLEAFFGYRIEALEPDLTVEQQSTAYGDALWQRDPDLCCTMRKVLPLRSKLGELDCWITGLRREQSESRAGIGVLERYAFDESAHRDIIKVNPMANWSRQAVWEYLRENQIPYNPLHDRGYRSIGCQPCTLRAGAGDSERAGRWVGFNKVECGIHTFMAKKA